MCDAIIPSSSLYLRKYLKPKLKTVSTKLSELPQTTTYHTLTYKHILGLAHYIGSKSGNRIRPKSGTNQGLALCIRPKSRNCTGPKTGTNQGLALCIGPKFGNCIKPKSETDWDPVPYIGPKSRLTVHGIA